MFFLKWPIAQKSSNAANHKFTSFYRLLTHKFHIMSETDIWQQQTRTTPTVATHATERAQHRAQNAAA
jgi:hypothetical protein